MKKSRPHLSEIYIYPVKSVGGISLQKAEVDSRGLRYDRRWMVVDETGTFLSQRRFPKMATITAAMDEHRLRLSAPDMPDITVPLKTPPVRQFEVRIWKDICLAYSCGTETGEWFSEILKLRCRLVYMPDESDRPADPAYSPVKTQVSFADAFPFLIISRASLDDLNSRLKEKLPMNRFRPNLVFSGTSAYAEDYWKLIRIGDVRLHVVKPCSRCVITTTDQKTGKTGREPLKTLATYRKVGDKVYFGQNAIQDNEGTLQVGYSLEILH